MKPFLKWVGGKQQLLPELHARLPESFNNYYEPFLGGGALFFSLADNILKDKKCFLNDLNSELINCYEMVMLVPEDIILQLHTYNDESSMEEKYYRVRNWDREADWPSSTSYRSRACRFYFLNKMAFNGLWRENSKGQMNAPWNKRTQLPVDEISLRRASEALQGTTLTCLSYDSSELLHGMSQSDNFTYFDPPYFPLSETASFTAYQKGKFQWQDQVDLRNYLHWLHSQGAYWMISNSDHPDIRNLYHNYRIESVQARRNINSKGDGRGHISELLITNY